MLKNVTFRLLTFQSSVTRSFSKVSSSQISSKSAQLTIPALKIRPTRQTIRKKPLVGRDSWSVVGYSTADEYNLLGLREKIEEQVIFCI